MILKVKNVYKIQGKVKAPSSKSYSHRAVILASLAKGESTLYNVLLSEDVKSTICACESLGAKIINKKDHLQINGVDGKLHNTSTTFIDLGNSGTSLRLLTSIAGLSDNIVQFSGDDSLLTRPMNPLLNALKDLGLKTESLNGRAPIKVYPGYAGGKTSIPGSISSQFI